MTSKHTRILQYGRSQTSRSYLSHCKKCGKKFEKNERILSKRSNGCRKVYYHEKCAEVLNII